MKLTASPLKNARYRMVAIVLVLAFVFTAMPAAAFAAPAQSNSESAAFSGGQCAQHYRVHKGDTLSGIALRFGVSMQAILQANYIRNANRIYAGQWLCIPHGHGYHPGHGQKPVHGKYYIVKRGNTLSWIARYFGTSVKCLMHANPRIHNPNRIYVGQKIKIAYCH